MIDLYNIYTEGKLVKAERDKLLDNEFGLPEDREYPLVDSEHIRKAIQLFKRCPESKREKLALNIYEKSLEHNVEISKDSLVFNYLPERYQSNIIKNKESNLNEGLIFSVEFPNFYQIPITTSSIEGHSHQYHNLMTLREDDKNERYDGIILSEGNNIVGYIQTDKQFGFITSLEVNPLYRRSGIGSQLLNSKYGNKADRVRIESDNIESENFFKKNGFECYRETPYFKFMKRKGIIINENNESPVEKNNDYMITDKIVDSKDILKSLNSKEVFYLSTQGVGNKVPIYNKNFKIKGKPAGFIQLYRYTLNTANVVFAIAPKYRGNGLIDNMLQTMLKEIEDKIDSNIDTLLWICSQDDEISKYLGKKYKFEESTSNSSKIIYKLNLNKRSMKLNSVLSE